MSIYDGLCDVGSAVDSRCPNSATRFRGEFAWCEKDGTGNTSLGDRTWPEIATQYKAKQERRAAMIADADAEAAGHFLYYDGEIYSPREMRQILRNGYNAETISVEENPLEWVTSYEREAEEAIGRKLAKARHIRSEYKRMHP